MKVWKCNICGRIDRGINPPIEHGRMGLVVYPNRNHSISCVGKWGKVEVQER